MNVVEKNSEEQHVILTIEIEPGTVSNSNMYKRIDENHVELVLCIRFGLFTGNPNADDSVEVNFREMIFKLYASLNEGGEEFHIEGLESDA